MYVDFDVWHCLIRYDDAKEQSILAYVLDLYRQGVLRFDQVMALGELQISWTGSESGEVEVTDEFDIPVVLEDDEPTEGSTNV